MLPRVLWMFKRGLIGFFMILLLEGVALANPFELARKLIREHSDRVISSAQPTAVLPMALLSSNLPTISGADSSLSLVERLGLTSDLAVQIALAESKQKYDLSIIAKKKLDDISQYGSQVYTFVIDNYLLNALNSELFETDGPNLTVNDALRLIDFQSMAFQLEKEVQQLGQAHPEFTILGSEVLDRQDILKEAAASIALVERSSFVDYEKMIWRSHLAYEEFVDKTRFLYYVPVPFVSVSNSLNVATGDWVSTLEGGLESSNFLGNIKLSVSQSLGHGSIFGPQTNQSESPPTPTFGLSFSLPTGKLLELNFDKATDRVEPYTGAVEQLLTQLHASAFRLRRYIDLDSPGIGAIDRFDVLTSVAGQLKNLLLILNNFSTAKEIFDEKFTESDGQ